MVFVKIDAQFIEINELSDAISVPIEQIEEFLNRGLLDDIESAKVCYPEQFASIKRMKSFVERMATGASATELLA